MRRSFTAAEGVAIDDLTDQVIQRIAGVPANIGLEALLRVHVQVLASVVMDRAEFDDLVARWPEGARAFADVCWEHIRDQVGRPIDPSERMQ